MSDNLTPPSAEEERGQDVYEKFVERVNEIQGWCPACGGSGMVMEFGPTDCSHTSPSGSQRTGSFRAHREERTMAEYTPTTEEIIRAYSIPTYHVVERLEGESFSEYLARASIEGHVSQVESEAAARRWLAAHDAEVRAGVVAEEPEWGVWDQRDRVFRHVHPPTEENARRESALGGSDFEATRALPWVPVKQEGAMPDA